MRGLIVAAPASGSGKTVVTLGILRALACRGHAVRGAKSGPDYIDPRFHEAATGRPCVNLDAWAMTPGRIAALAAAPSQGDLLIVEGAMGLFDGAPPDGRGATADLARQLGLPVVLVVDAARMAQSVAPVVLGFANHDPRVHVAGVILNRVGSDRHDRMLRAALAAAGAPPVLGTLRRMPGLDRPARHLGLVQAGEMPDLPRFLDRAAETVAETIDLDALDAIATHLPAAPPVYPWAPAQRIAVAGDEAFGFTYPHHLADWRASGAEVARFSPLADEAPPPDADLVILPGGYPELHAGRLAAATTFRAGMTAAAVSGIAIFGECGGYMVLGDGIEDADGARHAMLGLLGVTTSFARRRLHLGYRTVSTAAGPFAGQWAAHEFHYASVTSEAGPPLFSATDSEGTALPPMGTVRGRVSGSFAHLIDRCAGPDD